MSDLLNQASLVMVPSGYKEDTVYSVVPSDGSGDLSFTRASNGTRVNSAGLVEDCPWNLFEYSENFTNGYWSKVRSTATNNTTTAPNGTTTADTITCNDTGVNGCWVNSSLNLSTERTVSIYVKPNTCSYFQIHKDYGSGIVFNLNNGTIKSSSGGTGTITSVGDGWYYCTATFSTSGVIIYILGNSSMTVTSWASTNNENLYLWGAQLNIGSTAKPYFPTTDRLNVPRLTYQNGGGGCPSLLLEKQSTNLLTYSENFTNSDWLLSGATPTANTIISPDGTQNADTITYSATSYAAIYQSILTTSGTTYTASVYAKKGNQNFLGLEIRGSSSLTDTVFNLNTGVVVSGTGTIESVGNGWYRCSITKAANSASSLFIIGRGNSGGATDTLYLWGAQLEASSYPTSYINTTSASATRVADVMSVNLPNTDMTFCAYLECEEAPLGTTVGDWLSIYSDISILGRGYGYANTFGFADAYGMGITSATKMVWKQESGTTAKLFKNGALAATSTTGTYSDPFNRFRIDGAYLDKPLKIKEFVFFQNNLTDAECAALTA
jgi:hypothetical protein